MVVMVITTAMAGSVMTRFPKWFELPPRRWLQFSTAVTRKEEGGGGGRGWTSHPDYSSENGFQEICGRNALVPPGQLFALSVVFRGKEFPIPDNTCIKRAQLVQGINPLRCNQPPARIFFYVRIFYCCCCCQFGKCVWNVDDKQISHLFPSLLSLLYRHHPFLTWPYCNWRHYYFSDGPKIDGKIKGFDFFRLVFPPPSFGRHFVFRLFSSFSPPPFVPLLPLLSLSSLFLPSPRSETAATGGSVLTARADHRKKKSAGKRENFEEEIPVLQFLN